MKIRLPAVSRFFCSWGLLKSCLWTVTLIILFYAEEDWRGARAWAATKAKWEARGESFDFYHLIPPPIPDDENLAAIPFFKLEPDLEHDGLLEPRRLLSAFRRYPSDQGLPLMGSWQKGELPDCKKIGREIAAASTETLKGIPSSPSPLEQLDDIFPFIADLRLAAAHRPLCEFYQTYRYEFPDDLLIGLLTSQVYLTRILTLHEIIALGAKQPDLAFQDLQICLELESGLRRQPLLVAGVCGIAVNATLQTAIYDGLSLHVWNDSQLAGLEGELAQVDFLTDYQRAIRGECIGISLPRYDRLKVNRSALETGFNLLRDSSLKMKIDGFFPDLWPNGWLDWEKAQIADIDLEAVHFTDAGARRIYPDAIDKLSREIGMRESGIEANAGWNVFLREGTPSIMAAMRKFAQAQVWVDQGRIVCALERFRLVHRAYPLQLSDLTPAYISALPWDVFSGRPYLYRLRSDGSFLLYSVGWNQTDEGGKVIPDQESPRGPDSKLGDWVWPVLKEHN